MSLHVLKFPYKHHSQYNWLPYPLSRHLAANQANDIWFHWLIDKIFIDYSGLTGLYTLIGCLPVGVIILNNVLIPDYGASRGLVLPNTFWKYPDKIATYVCFSEFVGLSF